MDFDLIKILELCPKIKSLELIYCVGFCRHFNATGDLYLPHLESLPIDENIFECTDKIYNDGDVSLFKKLLTSSPKLKLLKLIDCEVISYILEFIPYPYIQDVRLVCRLWYQIACQNACILDMEKLVTLPFRDPIEFVETDRDFVHLTVEQIDDGSEAVWTEWLSSYNASFWKAIGPKVNSLVFNYCEIEADDLIKILKLCSRIKSLELIDCLVHCRDFDTRGELDLPHLESLSIYENGYQSKIYDDGDGSLFVELVLSTPKLKSLKLIDCELYHNTESDVQERRDFALECISGITDRLIELNFIDTAYQCNNNDGGMFTDWIQTTNLRLQKLDTDFPITLSVPQFHYLEYLALNRYLETQNVEEICSELPNLKSLDFKVRGKNVPSLAKLFRLEKLTYLRIFIPGHDYNEASDLGLMGGLCGGGRMSLATLVLRCNSCSPKTIVNVVKNHLSLTTLRLYCDVAMTDVSIQAIFKYLHSLKELKLDVCNVTNAGIHGFLLDAPDFDENPTGFSMSWLKNLRKLNLSNCNKITCLPLEIAPMLPELLVLSIDVNPMSANALISIIKHSPRLETLSVSSVRFSTKLVNEIINCLPRLRRLYLSYCNIKARHEHMLKAQGKRVWVHI